MTNLQEAKLAREAEICYVTVAMVTDYDCWHPHHDSVTVDQIVAVLVKNAENAAKVVRETVAAMPKERTCKCGSALAHAILTERDKIPAATRKKLSLILDKYLSESKQILTHEHTCQLVPLHSITLPRLRAAWKTCWAARPRISLWPPAISPTCAWSPWSAKTSPPSTKRC